MAQYKESELEKYLVQARKIAEHREVGAERKIKKIYKELTEDLNAWLGNCYAKYAEDDMLDFTILRQKGQYARFLEEAQLKVDKIYPKLKNTVEELIDTTYKVCWHGMYDGVTKCKTVENLHKAFKASRAITPEQIKAAVQNPIPKLRLNPILERNRRQIISNIRREIGVGLSNGDRMSTMARRISGCVGNDYSKSMLIARTEAHRVREVGFNDSSERIDRIMQDNNSDYRMVKTWRNKKDLAVRKTEKVNHVDMEGQTVLADEEFTLFSGAKAKCPGTSGIAAEDCNCRCRASRDIMNDAEFFAVSGRHFPGYVEPKPIEPPKQVKKKTDANKKPLTATPVNDTIKIEVSEYPKAFTATRAEAKNTQALMDYINDLDNPNPDTLQLYRLMGKMESVETEGIPFKISHASNHAVNSKYYRSSGKYAEVKITIPKIDSNNLIGAVNTTLHEEMHLMDLFLREDRNIHGAFTESKTLASRYITAVKTTDPTIGSKVKSVFKQFKDEYDSLKTEQDVLKVQKIQELKDEMFPDGKGFWSCSLAKFKEYEKRRKKIEKEITEEYDWKKRGIMGGGIDALQDIYDALNGGRYRGNEVMYGHGVEYYRSFSNRTSEILANYGALSMTRPDLIELLREDKPELVASLEQLIKDMIKKVK